MNKKYLLFSLFIIIFTFSFSYTERVFATVGGHTVIYNLTYNPQNESVYYIRLTQDGRGCPPELLKTSLNTGQKDIVHSCDEEENEQKINDTIKDFKFLSPLNLKDNKISIKITYIDSQYFDETKEMIRSNFTASVYQDNTKIGDIQITGCKKDQPFVFSGYSIPGFNKKFILLLSARGDCFEGGYIKEDVFVIGNMEILNRDYYTFYKNNTPLIPDHGSLIVFTDNQQYDFIYIYLFLIAIIFFILGLIAKTLSFRK